MAFSHQLLGSNTVDTDWTHWRACASDSNMFGHVQALGIMILLFVATPAYRADNRGRGDTAA